MENTMQKSIDIAKQAAEDAKRNAETEANAIISKAKLDASYLARRLMRTYETPSRNAFAERQRLNSIKCRLSHFVQML